MKSWIILLIFATVLFNQIKCQEEKFAYFIEEPDGENQDGEQVEQINDLGDCQPLTPNQTAVTNITITLGQSTPISPQRCLSYTIPLNYRLTDIILKSTFINHMIISDKQISECNEEQFKQCPNDSTLCINSKNTVEQTTSHQIGICLDVVYVMLYTNCTSSSSYGELYATYSDVNQTCNAIDDSDMKVKCSKFDSETCGNPDKKLCYDTCAWIECTIKDEFNKNRTVFGQCVPTSNYRQQDWDEICRANYEFNTVEETDILTGQNKAVAYPIWCGDVPPVDVAKQVADQLGVSEDSVWGSLFLFIFFIFLLSICFYRMKFKRDGVPPFNPPSCCPNFIYPRTYQVRNYSGEQEVSAEMSGYQPPQNL